jgi:hypothetical protein
MIRKHWLSLYQDPEHFKNQLYNSQELTSSGLVRIQYVALLGFAFVQLWDLGMRIADCGIWTGRLLSDDSEKR